MELEQSIGFSLPQAYQQYLAWMGLDEQGIFAGTNCFLKDAMGNTEWLPGLLAENNLAFNLSEHFLAFFSHQGYVMAWFDLPKTGDNPPVWYWGEGQGLEAPIQKGTFTEFLMDQLQGVARMLSR